MCMLFLDLFRSKLAGYKPGFGDIGCMDMKVLSKCCWKAGWKDRDLEKDKRCSMVVGHIRERRKDCNCYMEALEQTGSAAKAVSAEPCC